MANSEIETLIHQSSLLAERVHGAVERTLGPASRFIPLHEPEFAGQEWTYVKDCIDTGWVSSAGGYVEKFERSVASFLGVKHGIATVNGTTALHLALKLVGVQPGDEVVAPTLSFAATAAAIAHCGATPHFVDVSATTLGMDPELLKRYFRSLLVSKDGVTANRITGRRVAAIVPMHTFGIPVDVAPLVELAESFEIPVVEDAAESLGSTYFGKHCGNFGIIAATSFNGNKIVTTGGGGMILTNNDALAQRAKHLSTTAKLPHAWLYEHDEVGYNYRLPNINAALGVAQMERLPSLLERKRKLAKAYERAFADVPGVNLVTEPEGCVSNYWLNAILLPASSRHDTQDRDAVLKRLNGSNYMARPAWTLLHKLRPYANSPRMEHLEVADDIEARLINLPSSPQLAERLSI